MSCDWLFSEQIQISVVEILNLEISWNYRYNILKQVMLLKHYLTMCSMCSALLKDMGYYEISDCMLRTLILFHPFIYLLKIWKPWSSVKIFYFELVSFLSEQVGFSKVFLLTLQFLIACLTIERWLDKGIKCEKSRKRIEFISGITIVSIY